jgi:hypothetical protein
MTPADLRTLMATAEYQPGETTEQYNARHDAEHQLSSWRVWLPGLLGCTPFASREACEVGAIEAVRLLEHAEEINANCEECEGEGAPELCGSCFPLFDAARVQRRLVMQSLAVLSPITPASQVSGGAPAVIRNPPAGAHSSEVSQ